MLMFMPPGWRAAATGSIGPRVGVRVDTDPHPQADPGRHAPSTMGIGLREGQVFKKQHTIASNRYRGRWTPRLRTGGRTFPVRDRLGPSQYSDPILAEIAARGRRTPPGTSPRP